MEKQHQPTLTESVSGIISSIRRLGSLYIDKARLKTTEKLTILLSTIAFTVVLAAIIILVIAFVSIGVGHLLASSVAPHLAYLFVAGFYVLLLFVALALRRRLFIDPIARFMSRLLVDAPADEDDEAEEHRGERPDRREEPAADNAAAEIDYDKLARHIIDMLEKDKPAETVIIEEGGQS